MPAGDLISGMYGTIKIGEGEYVAALYQVTNWKRSGRANISKRGTNHSGKGKRVVAGKQDYTFTWEQALDDANSIPFVEGDFVDAQFHIDGDGGNYIGARVCIASIDGPEVDIDQGREVTISVTAEVDGEESWNGNI